MFENYSLYTTNTETKSDFKMNKKSEKNNVTRFHGSPVQLFPSQPRRLKPHVDFSYLTLTR